MSFSPCRSLALSTLLTLGATAALSGPATMVVGAGPGLESTYYDDDAVTRRVATHFSFGFDLGPARVKSSGGGVVLDFGLTAETRLGVALRKGKDLDLTDSTDPARAALPQITGGADIGLELTHEYVGFMGDDTKLITTATLLGNVDGPGGVHFGAAGELRRDIGANRVWLGLGLHGGDATYRQAYFGISAAEAAASGLPVSTYGAGLTDMSVTVGYARPLSRNLYAGASLSYAHLLGDAADSAKIARPESVKLGVGLGYRVEF